MVDAVVWVPPVPDQAPSVATWLRAWQAAPGIKRPRHVRRYATYLQALAHLDIHSFDLVWAERTHMAALCQSFSRKTIVDLDDIEHRKLAAQRRADSERGLWQKLLLQYRHVLYQRIELRWVRRFAATVVCSDGDQQYLRNHGAGSVIVVPNGTQAVRDPALDVAGDRPCTSGSALRMVFLGHLNHMPNQDAIRYFHGQILPLIQAQAPAADFGVIGGADDPQLNARFSQFATLHGFVEQLPPALAAHDVFVAPIRFGSGTRVKLLDAMACGIPIVTTPEGAEGLPLIDGKHALIRSDPKQFAEAVLRLHASPELAEALSSAALALVRERFDNGIIRQQLAAWLKDFLQHHTRASAGAERAG